MPVTPEQARAALAEAMNGVAIDINTAGGLPSEQPATTDPHIDFTFLVRWAPEPDEKTGTTRLMDTTELGNLLRDANYYDDGRGDFRLYLLDPRNAEVTPGVLTTRHTSTENDYMQYQVEVRPEGAPDSTDPLTTFGYAVDGRG